MSQGCFLPTTRWPRPLIPASARTRIRRHPPIRLRSIVSASIDADNAASIREPTDNVSAFIDASPARSAATSSVDDAERIKRLTDQLRAAKLALDEEEKRQRVLAPFRVSAPRRGIIGNSRYAQTLRKNIRTAANDTLRAPVLIFGEPGLQKTNIASLIHFQSKFSQAPLVRLDCARLDEDASELVGRGAKRGLMAWLPPDATIILDNVHMVGPAVMPLLQREVATASMCATVDEEDEQDAVNLDLNDVSDVDSIEAALLQRAAGSPSGVASVPTQLRCSFPRIIMTAEKRVPALEPFCFTVIKVPPLRVRPEDIPDLAKYFLRTLAREQELGRLELTPDAERRIVAGAYPNNVVELEGVVGRAVAQTLKVEPSTGDTATSSAEKKGRGSSPRLIGEEVLWTASQPKDRLRVINLLRTVPGLREFLRSDWWPERINFEFTKYAFAVVVAALFIFPQDRDNNVALNIFWCYWWPGVFIVYPFLGRVWCAVCPFMIYGEIVQRWQTSRGVKLMKWPRDILDRWGAWFLFGLFALILVWEECWDLPQNASLSSWLLLLITFGAMIGSFFYERRVWCRYLCPVGGMNGLFAKLSVTELRARQGVCSATCSTYGCYKGGPAVPPEGQATDGCPVYSHPAQLTDNRNCVLCMDCLKACPHGSIEFRLRLPAAGIWSGEHTALRAEVALMFLLLGAVYVHDLPHVLMQFGWMDPVSITNARLPHIAASAVVLALPGSIAVGADALWRVAADVLRPSAAQAVLQPASGASAMLSGGKNVAESKAIAVLNAAAGSYASQEAGAMVIAPSKPFYEIAYGFLPMVWTATLAWYLPLLLLEGGHVLPVAFRTVWLEPPAWVPSYTANPAVVTFLQGGFLLFGAALSLGLTRRVAAQPWKVIIPHCLCIVAFTAELWYLLIK
jgi:polyferredoxin